MGKTSLVFGGNGAQGRAIIKQLKMTNWKVVSVDTQPNKQADINIEVSKNKSFMQQFQTGDYFAQISKYQFNSIICLTGAMSQGSICDKNIFESYQQQREINIEPALVAAHLATQSLAVQGMLVFLGSSRAFDGPLDDALYSFLTKNAVHHLALQMSTKQELPETSTVLTLLQQKNQNQESVKQEVSHEQMAFQIRQWADGIDRPSNGSFARLKFEDGKLNTTFV